MIVTIEDTVFRARANPLLLLSILRYGLEGRHVVLTDPPFKPTGRSHVNEWLDARDALVRMAATDALERSLRAFPSTPSIVEVRVAVREQSHWQGRPPLLTPDDAVLLLALPLRLLLEDRFADKHFLLCLAPPPRRSALERALQQGWCHAEHGGGVGNMGNYIEGLREEPSQKLRTWVMFDSDAAAPGQPSTDSEGLKEKCREMLLPHHQLCRRSIENYLPLQVLHNWVSLGKGPERTERRKRVEEFASMTKEQRRHLKMKEHFGDRHIADLFRGEKFKIEPDWLDRDDQRPEINAIMQGLFERI